MKHELVSLIEEMELEETLYKKKDPIKEIKYLIYLKSELIRQTKKEIKQLHKEIDTLNKEKTKKNKSRR